MYAWPSGVVVTEISGTEPPYNAPERSSKEELFVFQLEPYCASTVCPRGSPPTRSRGSAPEGCKCDRVGAKPTSRDVFVVGSTRELADLDEPRQVSQRLRLVDLPGRADSRLCPPGAVCDQSQPVPRYRRRGSQPTGDVRESWFGHDVLQWVRPGQRRPPHRALDMGEASHRGNGIGDWGGYSVLMTFTRITVRADQMDGVPCIRGLRIPVATVVGMIAEGITADEVLDAYPDLELADVQEALQYAAEAVRERELPLAG